jgi:hypothetical protein
MEANINIILFYGALFLFVVLYYGPWQTLCVDVARHKMFKARNAIFDLAAQGKMSFDSEAYRKIREEIELLIRFSHRLDWATLSLIIIPIRYMRLNLGTRIDTDALAAVISNQQVRKAVQKHMKDVKRATIYLLIQRSIFLSLMAFTFVLWLIIKAVVVHAGNSILKNARMAINDEWDSVSSAIIPEIQNSAEMLERREQLSCVA